MERRVAVVTGAGSGIGRALALRLAGHGFDLAISDVDEVGLGETDRLLGGRTDALVEKVDVSERDAVHAHADAVSARFGRVDLVVNNAGVALDCSVLEQAHEDIRWVMDVDFWGVVHGTEAFLPRLVDHGRGHLVNISSVFGLVGVVNQSAYNAAKFAVRGYTEALQQELDLARVPVSVHCVHPGGVRTEIARRARSGPSGDPARTAALFDKVAMTTPDAAARAIIRGVRRGRKRILVGPDAVGFEAMQRVLGTGYQPILRNLWGRAVTR